MLPLVAVLGAMAAARARAEGYSAIDFLGASHTVLRAAAQRKAGDTTFVAVGRTWDSTSTPPGYRALLASYQVLDGGQDIPFAGGNGQLGKIVVDLAGNGFDNLCNAVTYAYDGYIAACRSMNGLAWYDLYLVKFTAAGVLDTTFGTNGVAATGVGGDATDGHALPRGIVYNGGTNLANGGVVTVVGALGKFSPGDFHPFIASFDQKTGAQIGPTVTSSLVGTATAVTFDGAAGGVGYYYVASTETSGTKTFYIDRYNVDLDVSTAPWGSAIDFSAAGGGTDSVPAGIAVYNADVVAVGGNRSGAGAWRCAAVAVKMADGNLDTAFGSATIAGGVDDKGITLFPNPTNASYDCILNAVATPPSGGALVVGGTAYVDHTGIFNYDHLLAELNPTGDFVTTFDLDGIKIQALGGADDVINSLLFFDNVGKVYGIGRSQNTSQTNGATAAEVWTTMAAIENWSASTTTNAPAPRYDATGVWTGSTLVVWGGRDGSGAANTGGSYDPTANSWLPTATANAPALRSSHAAVWTGSKMLVWGGVNDSSDPQNTGGVYDPAGNAWTAMTTTNAPEPRDSFHSVWTGTHMIVFGGYSGITTFNDGGRYDPASNTWNPMSTTNAPPPRIEGNIVWTGARMIAWGGQDSSDMNTGGIYDPKGNAWTPMTTVGAPSPRHEHAGVWTGSKMIVWGGYPSGVTNDGGIYDPSANSWAPLTTANAPSARRRHTAVWTGAKMLVWGGIDDVTLPNSGGYYDPGTGSWSATSTTNAPGGRQYHAAVWTGSQLLVWGGYNATDRLNTGGVLAPISLTAGGPGGTFTTNTSDTWTAMTTANAPASRYAAAGTWSGTKFVAWGGNTGAAYLNTGGSFDLTTKTWSAVATANAPSKRGFFSATWVGSKALVWGGYGGTDLNNGGLYDPVANSWTATSTTNAPSKRNAYTATWSGTQYLVFGGASPDPTPVNSGGRYEPATDKWYRMSTTNAPPPRFYSSSVWTGSKMIVWGGSIVSGTGGTSLATGGVYDPSLDKWTPMTTTGAPASGACLHSTTWLSGLGKMFYWGGQSSNCGAITFAVASYLNQGALYDLANNAWTTLPTGNGPGRRSQHIAGWNGAKVYVWGGQGAPAAAQAGLNTGAVYDPSAGTWSTMTASTTNHVDPAMTWTGAKLIVWGGRPNATSSTPNNIGYYYTP